MTRTFWDDHGRENRSGLSEGGYPTRKMLFASRPPKLKKNPVNGSYKNAEDYISIHTNLLLEDFMYPLREALKQFKRNPHKDNFNGVRIYRPVNLTQSKTDRQNKSSIYYVTGLTSLEIASQEGEVEPSFGRLLLFTKSNFEEDLIMGKVKSDRTGELKIEIQLGTPYSVGKYIMMQPDAFYYKYEHILRLLDSFNEDNFPMKEYIVYGRKTVQYPGYIKLTTAYNVFGQKIRVLPKWKLNNETIKMNKSQLTALEKALTRKLAVVQGPPGTGKTYFGVLMVKVLLDNVRVWNPTGRTPLLVVCHSNKALDNFLEGLLKYTGDIVRVGDQSQSEKLERFTLNALLRAKLMDNGKRFKSNPRTITKEILQGAQVIGMTTTGASARRDLLTELMPPIVIVEEAAEVLEVDVIASMTLYCKHLILLGDHKQLKPITTTHHLAVDYNLNTSLFERLIRNQTVEVSCLTTQYRMRPEISALIKPYIYKQLDDDPSTLNRPAVKGILKSVFFFHHEYPEDTVEGEYGYFNSYEARMVIALANYLVSVGYGCSKITVIAMYVQQRNKLEVECTKYPALENLEIASVDSFQGRENEIILLSLVRNNDAGKIGFLEEQTRACVALSRARQGLVIMGNKKCLEKADSVWSNVVKRLSEQDAIVNTLTLFCEKHGVTQQIFNPQHLNNRFCFRCGQDQTNDEFLMKKTLVEQQKQAGKQTQQKKGTQEDFLKSFGTMTLKDYILPNKQKMGTPVAPISTSVAPCRSNSMVAPKPITFRSILREETTAGVTRLSGQNLFLEPNSFKSYSKCVQD